MSLNDKARIRWSCRRGMLELDMCIMPFFEYEYDGLSDKAKDLFIRLLLCNDIDLFSWLINKEEPKDEGLKKIIQMMKRRNKIRGTISM